MWAEVAYGMPPAKAGVDSRAAQLIGFPRISIIKQNKAERNKKKKTEQNKTTQHKTKRKPEPEPNRMPLLIF